MVTFRSPCCGAHAVPCEVGNWWEIESEKDLRYQLFHFERDVELSSCQVADFTACRADDMNMSCRPSLCLPVCVTLMDYDHIECNKKWKWAHDRLARCLANLQMYSIPKPTCIVIFCDLEYWGRLYIDLYSPTCGSKKQRKKYKHAYIYTMKYNKQTNEQKRKQRKSEKVKSSWQEFI